MTWFTTLLLTFPFYLSAGEFISFPPDFKWCVGISSHQHEGNNIHSDWWAFEQSSEKIPDSGIAVDHWNRYEEDLQLVNELAVGQFRITLEWARIEPREGVWDWDAIAHYQKVIQRMEELGIEPLITLHQLSLPLWFKEKGDFAWAGAPDAFSRFAQFSVSVIAPKVKWWTTSVDGAIHLIVGFATDLLPPQKNNIKAVGPAMLGFLKAHAAAYRAMHQVRDKTTHPIKVGIVHFIRLFDAKNILNPLHVITANLMDKLFNWTLSDAIHAGKLKLFIPFLFNINEEIPGLKGAQDFIGLNYYTRSMVDVSLLKILREGVANQIKRILNTPKKGAPVTDMGWEIYSKGMYRTLMQAKKHYPGTPFYITESGLADSSDSKRLQYTKDYLYQTWRAINQGVPVIGFCHWSLTDNFEWLEGFVPRFGLYEIDYSTLERRARPSASAVRQIALDNGFSVTKPLILPSLSPSGYQK